MKTCEWTETDEGSESGCGELFIFNDGGPIDNGFIYCPYCGKKISIKHGYVLFYNSSGKSGNDNYTPMH